MGDVDRSDNQKEVWRDWFEALVGRKGHESFEKGAEEGGAGVFAQKSSFGCPIRDTAQKLNPHAVYTIERAVTDMPGKADAEETETARPQIIAF
jgi:hypothetical protein